MFPDKESAENLRSPAAVQEEDFILQVKDFLKSIPEKLASMPAKKFGLIAFLVSFLAALIIYGIFRALAGPGEAPGTAQNGMVSVVVAASDIPNYTKIDRNMVKLVTMPKETAPDGAEGSLDEVTGKTVQVPVLKGDVLTSAKINAGPGGFAGMIPANMRAITIPLSDVTGVAGFARPGDRVDIFFVSTKSYKDIVYGKLMLQNVLLLGINKTSAAQASGQPAPAGGAAAGGAAPQGAPAGGAVAMATVAVSPSDAMKLIAAQQEGTLYLALRPGGADQGWSFVPDYFYYMSGSSGAAGQSAPQAPGAPAVTPAAPVSQPPSYTPPAPSYAPAPSASSYEGGRTVEVIRGNAVSQVQVK